MDAGWSGPPPLHPPSLCGRGAEEFSEREREGEGSVVAEVLFVFWLEQPFFCNLLFRLMLHTYGPGCYKVILRPTPRPISIQFFGNGLVNL